MPNNNEEYIEDKLHGDGLAEVDDPVHQHGQELQEEDYEEGERNSALLDVRGHLLHLSLSQLGSYRERARRDKEGGRGRRGGEEGGAEGVGGGRGSRGGEEERQKGR